MVSSVTISSLSSSLLSRSSPRAVCTYTQPLSTVISPLTLRCRIGSIHRHRCREIPSRSRRISAVSEDVVPPLVENAPETVSSVSADGEATIIQALLIIAFICLSVLTIGVIYIAVTDFLQKREKDKFEKEEAAAKKSGKKSDKKRKAPATRAGPRGFGQVRKEDEEFDD